VFVTVNVYVTVCPTAFTDAGLADLAIASDGDWVAGTVAVAGGEVTLGPDGGVPDAVAESLIDPLSRSACVTVYVAVNVPTWPGTNAADEPKHVPAGLDNDRHVGPDVNPPAGACCVSLTDTSVRSTLPVFVTVNVYVTVCPTAFTDAGAADLVIASDGDWVAGTVAVDGGEVTLGPDGGVPDAVAESLIDPLSRSACVTVYVAVNVATCPGTNDVDEPEHAPVGFASDWHVGSDVNPDCTPADGRASRRPSPPSSCALFCPSVALPMTSGPPPGACWVSSTDTSVRPTFPVFVTVNVYVTVCPTVSTDAGLADLAIASDGDWVAGTVAVAGDESIGSPVGGVPDAVAESLIEPLSRSACVTVYVAVNVATWPGTNAVDEPEHEPDGLDSD
jgi:hypothetical protein